MLFTHFSWRRLNKHAMAHPGPSPCELPWRTEVEGTSTLSLVSTSTFSLLPLGLLPGIKSTINSLVDNCYFFWLFWCAGNSVCFGNHYSCVTCKWWVMASSSLTPPSLSVSSVLIFPRLPSPARGGVLHLSAAASLVPWRGIAGKHQPPWTGHFARISLENKLKTLVNTKMQ